VTTIREESLKCPRCGCVFLATGLSSFGFAGKDTDGRPFFWGISPLPFFVKTCPECDFSAFSADFILETKLSQKREIPLSPAEKYLKAALCYEELGNMLQAARAYQHAAWLFLDNSEQEKACGCYAKAYARYLEVSRSEENPEILYLAGECARRAGKIEVAREIFDDLLLRPLPGELRELVFKAKDSL